MKQVKNNNKTMQLVWTLSPLPSKAWNFVAYTWKRKHGAKLSAGTTYLHLTASSAIVLSAIGRTSVMGVGLAKYPL